MAKRHQPRIIPVNHFSAQALRRCRPGQMKAADIRRVFGPARYAAEHDGRALRFKEL